ncbi:phospholipid scramblase 2-like isoform X3 [Dinothrombium tinctorium]|uniref:Phospholipid scramblase n=1 Tax=Dinothrombium tinctorium TaxID=1965070 RepID=A0A3S3PNG6_9ACAR|nr:phospholipid scramblase 2-like isoform X3 [Dinothrombium tinctorium]RWS05150.1 phospholipid scramblase 2-like isoform X3 [Dinothrombium tinctorium]
MSQPPPPPPGILPNSANFQYPSPPAPVPVNASPGIQSHMAVLPHPGLQYLTQLDQLLIHQLLERFEIMSGWETENRYIIKNTLGQQIYFAAEQSDSFSRAIAGSHRDFTMKILDNYNQEVINIYRPAAFFIQSDPIRVFVPPGHILGYITQEFNLAPTFNIHNPRMEIVLRIEAPLLSLNFSGDVHYNILGGNHVKIGRITKQWSGYVQEMFTDADNFSLTFPIDLDVSYKAILLAAVFLIDFSYHENNHRKKKRVHPAMIQQTGCSLM